MATERSGGARVEFGCFFHQFHGCTDAVDFFNSWVWSEVLQDLRGIVLFWGTLKS